MKTITALIILLLNLHFVNAQDDIAVKLSIEKKNDIVWPHTTITNIGNQDIYIPGLAFMDSHGALDGTGRSWIIFNAISKTGTKIRNADNKIYYCRETSRRIIPLLKGESYTRRVPLYDYPQTRLYEWSTNQDEKDIYSIQAEVHLEYGVGDILKKVDILSNRVVIE